MIEIVLYESTTVNRVPLRRTVMYAKMKERETFAVRREADCKNEAENRISHLDLWEG